MVRWDDGPIHNALSANRFGLHPSRRFYRGAPSYPGRGMTGGFDASPVVISQEIVESGLIVGQRSIDSEDLVSVLAQIREAVKAVRKQMLAAQNATTGV